MLYSLRLMMEAVVSFFQRLPQPILTFTSFFCFGLFSLSTAGCLIYLTPMAPWWQTFGIYALWAASVGTILIHWNY